VSAPHLTDLASDRMLGSIPRLRIEIPVEGDATAFLLCVNYEQEERLRLDLRTRDLLSDVLYALDQLADLLGEGET